MAKPHSPRQRAAVSFRVGVLAALLCACGTTGAVPESTPEEAIRTPDGSGGTNHPSVLERNYVVLVSFDGFRPDYLDRFETPAFDRIARAGVVADGLIPVFPSLTFPNHYSIATGLYPDRHGIVGNRFYDHLRGEEFNYREQHDTQDGTWWEGEPIWVTAERQGMVAAAVFFPGTEAAIRDVRPSHWQPYDATIRNTDRVRQVLRWLDAPPPERPHLITLYFSMVDGAGHDYGPDGPAVGTSVRAADRLLGQLSAGISQLTHGNQVYLVVTSDHGMASVDPARQVVLPEIVDLRGVRAIPTGPGMSLYLNGDDVRARQLRDVFNARTSAARAFVRDEVPEHLHHRASQRIGDVVIVPEEGAFVRFRADSAPPLATHGWDPTFTSMHGIFLMCGPGIRPGQRVAAFENIHIYPLVAHVLELPPNPGIDGQLDVLGQVLTMTKEPE